MPWTAADAKSHKKGLNPTQSKAWAEIANNVLKEKGDEATAIKVANAKAPAAKRATNYKKDLAADRKVPELKKVPKVSASGIKNPKALPKGKVIVGKPKKGT